MTIAGCIMKTASGGILKNADGSIRKFDGIAGHDKCKCTCASSGCWILWQATNVCDDFTPSGYGTPYVHSTSSGLSTDTLPSPYTEPIQSDGSGWISLGQAYPMGSPTLVVIQGYTFIDADCSTIDFTTLTPPPLPTAGNLVNAPGITDAYDPVCGCSCFDWPCLVAVNGFYFMNMGCSYQLVFEPPTGWGPLPEGDYIGGDLWQPDGSGDWQWQVSDLTTGTVFAGGTIPASSAGCGPAASDSVLINTDPSGFTYPGCTGQFGG